MSYTLSFLRPLIFALEGSLVFPYRQLVIMHCLCHAMCFPKLCRVSLGKHRAGSGISVSGPCSFAGFCPEFILKAYVYIYIYIFFFSFLKRSFLLEGTMDSYLLRCLLLGVFHPFTPYRPVKWLFSPKLQLREEARQRKGPGLASPMPRGDLNLALVSLGRLCLSSSRGSMLPRC